MSQIKRYRVRPCQIHTNRRVPVNGTIEAICWDGKEDGLVVLGLNCKEGSVATFSLGSDLYVLFPGDYMARGSSCVIFCMRAAEFEETYEEIPRAVASVGAGEPVQGNAPAQGEAAVVGAPPSPTGAPDGAAITPQPSSGDISHDAMVARAHSRIATAAATHAGPQGEQAQCCDGAPAPEPKPDSAAEGDMYGGPVGGGMPSAPVPEPKPEGGD